ncbi:Down syndrome cell adhesion molecule protein Dscam2-like [Tropilaelaps mercedesae]|uniref:Down syndrome cell adhesion molecule protein Dscam2-like n=1 Tax=Tropilaelaps mercedesae TaxID=418985 RepID=A0A1V9XNN1_9ACAR|nr:Down syndrome cell adhesion molecule protein Dscam2-like [Tropilaelaps mercedesae]
MEFTFQLVSLPHLAQLQGVLCADQVELRICQSLLEIIYKRERSRRIDWSPCRVFSGLQVANVAYETGSRIMNNVLHYEVLVESIRNLVEFITVFQMLRAVDVTIGVSIQVKNYILSLAGVANAIELSKGLSRFPWEMVAEELVTKARSIRLKEPQLTVFTPADLPKLHSVVRVRALKPDISSTYQRFRAIRAESSEEKLLIRVRNRNEDYSEEKAIASVLTGMPCVEYHAFFCTKRAHVFVQRGPEGPLLSEVFSHKRKFRCSELVDTANAIVNAVSALHALGVIHRNVRPDCMYYYDRNVKFANVEHARVCIGNYIRNREWLPTFFVRTSMEFYADDEFRWSLKTRREFQAPEIVAGRPYGRAADWWAVGVTLFKMACGHLPFREGNNVSSLIQRILSDEIKWEPRFQKKKAPFKDFVLSLLMKDPSQRLGSKDYRDILHHKVFKPQRKKKKSLRMFGPKSRQTHEKENYKAFDAVLRSTEEKSDQIKTLEELGPPVTLACETFVSLQWRGYPIDARGKVCRLRRMADPMPSASHSSPSICTDKKSVEEIVIQSH